jgi:protein TonB
LDATTLLSRTAAGDAELAAAHHGLSIPQRRILTLLDTPARVDGLGARQPSDRDWLQRDVVRLVQCGLVREQSAANAEPPSDALAAIRLGAPALTRRILVVAVAAALAWAGWHYLASRVMPASAHAGPAPIRVDSESGGTAGAGSEPTVIATRVLRGDIADRTREAIRAGTAIPAANAPKTGEERPAAEPRKTGDLAVAHAPAADEPSRPDSAVAVTSTAPARQLQSAPAASSPDAPVAHPFTPVPTAMQQSPPATTQAAPSPAATSPASSLPESAAPTSAAPAPSAALTAPAQLASATPSSPVHVASAAPAAAATRQDVPVKLVPVSREAPEFPREAIAQGVESGTVKARLAIDAQGNVTGVDIIDASPRRVFDRAVRNALARWQFQPGSAGRSTTVDIAFRRD